MLTGHVNGSADPQERLKETVEVAKALQSEGYTSIGLYGFCCKSFPVFMMSFDR